MDRKITFEKGEIYHVYNRGVEKRSIFRQARDWSRFHQLLYIANSERRFNFSHIPNDKSFWRHQRGDSLVDVGLYVLMDNHFHLVLHGKEKNGISKFMQKLATAYSMYFNTRYQRSGPLFTRPFKAKVVDEDRYLDYLFSYVHLNPLKKLDPLWKERGVKNMLRSQKFVRDYPFSSYRDYLGESRECGSILSRAVFPFSGEMVTDFQTLAEVFVEYNTESR